MTGVGGGVLSWPLLGLVVGGAAITAEGNSREAQNAAETVDALIRKRRRFIVGLPHPMNDIVSQGFFARQAASAVAALGILLAHQGPVVGGVGRGEGAGVGVGAGSDCGVLP
jgi:hypothetical protein